MGQINLEFYSTVGVALTSAAYADHNIVAGQPVSVNGTALDGGYVYADGLDEGFELIADNPEAGIFGFIAENQNKEGHSIFMGTKRKLKRIAKSLIRSRTISTIFVTPTGIAYPEPIPPVLGP